MQKNDPGSLKQRLLAHGVNLTGDPEQDLFNLSELAKINVLDRELVELIREALYPIIGQTDTDSFIDTICSTADEYSRINDRAVELSMAGKPDEALRILQDFIDRFEAMNLYQETEDTEYHFFQSPFQEYLFLYHYMPQKTIRAVHFPIPDLYLASATLLRESGRFKEAVKAMKTAEKYNPAEPIVLVNLAIAQLADGSQEQFLGTLHDAFKFAFKPDDIAYIYRTLGMYYAAKDIPDAAIVCYTLAGIYNPQFPMDESISRIENKLGNRITPLSFKRIEACGKRYGFPVLPDNNMMLLAVAVYEDSSTNDDAIPIGQITSFLAPLRKIIDQITAM